MSINSWRARAQLSASDVVVVRGGRIILNELSVALGPGSRLGVVGENGQGKSTLIHVLSGRLQPDVGQVTRLGTMGVAQQELTAAEGRTVGALIDVELAHIRKALERLDRATYALASDQPGADVEYAEALDLASALDAWDADRRVDVALLELGAVTERDRLLVTMSVGERYRVRLACLLGAGHDFLLLDEPTNHLDAHGLDFLTTALQQSPAGIVLVTHDRVLLADVATSVLDLDPSVDGRARVYGGGYAGYLDGRRVERSRWEQAYAEHQAEHERLTIDLSAAQNRLRSGWRPPKGTGKHQRATHAPSQARSVSRRLEALHEHEVTRPPAPLIFTFPAVPALPGTPLIDALEVTLDGRLDTPVNATVQSGGRLLITGPNGSGKSTLLAVMAGLLDPTSGTVRRAPGARLSIVAQESAAPPHRTAFEAFEAHINLLVRDGADRNGTVPLRALGLLGPSDLSRPVSELSVGQQRRLDLAMALAARPHCLLLDEPTNHLSMALVDELIEALELTEAGVVIVTHDRQLRRDLDHWPVVAMSNPARH